MTSIPSTDRVSVMAGVHPEALSCPLSDHRSQAAGLQLKQTNGLGKRECAVPSLSVELLKCVIGNTEYRQPIKTESGSGCFRFVLANFTQSCLYSDFYSFVKARIQAIIRPYTLALRAHVKRKVVTVTCCNTQGNVTLHMYTHLH